MALIDPCLYLQADAHPARSFRQLITEMLGEGVLASTAMAVSQRAAGANFSVDVAAGRAVVQGDSATQQGHYLCVNDATVNDASTVVTSAPSAGNERYDLVILEVKDNAEDAGGLNLPRFRVVAGTPAAVGTATAPAVPNTALLLATIGPILNTTTTITNSLIVDGRVRSRLGPERGWTLLTALSGWTSLAYYKRLGDVGFLVGTALRTSSYSGASTFGTLPVGFRPVRATQTPAFRTDSYTEVAHVNVQTNGDVVITVSTALSGNAQFSMQFET